MALTLRYGWRGSCPRHRKYDPAREGEGGIKGGCEYCRALLALWAAWDALMGGMKTRAEQVGERLALETSAERVKRSNGG